MRKIKQEILAIGILLLMTMASLPIIGSSGVTHNPMTSNVLYFKDSPKDVNVGDTFRFDVWCDVNLEINTVSEWNVTYLPAGIINSSASFQRGTIFWAAYPDNELWNSGGAAHNNQGWRLAPTWGVNPGYERNNTDELAINNTWYARSAGTATVSMVSDLSGDPGTFNGSALPTTISSGIVRVHPVKTSGFDAYLSSAILVSFSWTKGAGAVNTVIRGSKTGYPLSPTDGTWVYNNTGTTTTQPIDAGDHWYYRAWSYSGGLYSLLNQTDQIQSNSPPVFGTPSPTNGTGGQNLDFTWSIPISDPEGNIFNFTIQCSNGQGSALATGEHNGTKNFHLTGLAYLTTYTVWVNATDTGSHLWTRAWYTFTTKADTAPIQGSPNPTNGSSGNALSLSWSVSITDADLDSITWTIQCNNGQSTSCGGGGGTKSISLGGLAYSTTYKIWVNGTDGTLWTRAWYTFSTKLNVIPTQTSPIPSNGTTGTSQSLSWKITLTDPDELITWTIQCSNGQSTSGTNTASGQKTLSLTGLSPLTWYTVWVNLTDGIAWSRAWYNFKTAANTPPVFGTPSPVNGSTGRPLSFTWSIPITDNEGDTFSWYIHCSNGQTSSGGATGTGTATISLTGLSYLTPYTIWVNATDTGGSGGWTRRVYTFTTVENQPPNVPTIIMPADGQTNVAPNMPKLRVHVTDPENHDMNVEYFWGNGTSIGTEVGVQSGHISQLKIPKLLENTNYSWYVNITDEYGAWTIGPAGAPLTNWTFRTGMERQKGGVLGEENEIVMLVLFEYEPISGAIITIYQTTIAQGIRTQGGVVSTAATEQNGMRQFVLPSGTYMLDVKAPGYKALTQTLIVTQDASIVVSLEKTVSELGYWYILIIILIIVAFLVTVLIKRDAISDKVGLLIVVLLNVVAIILALIFFWPLLIAGALLFIVEVIWIFGYVGN